MASPSEDSWADLPGDILQAIGSLFTDARHLSNANLVCKSWKGQIAGGVNELHVDMNPTLDAWDSRVQRLGSLVPRLARCKAHVSSAVPKMTFPANLQRMADQLDSIEHLHLELSEGFELWLDSGMELASLRRLRSLTLSGGNFSGLAAQRLLKGLAIACPHLEELHVLPLPRSGLGDEEVPLLNKLTGLKVLEFQAYRLTSTGLAGLMGLESLECLSIHGLDSWASNTACFRMRPSLKELHLGCEYELPPEAVQRLRDVPDLSMRFRWTDKLHGLLKTCSLHLSQHLVKLDLGCCRLGSEASCSALDNLSCLTGLTDLRMSVYSNSDTRLTLDLSQLAPLSNLQVLHLTKQHAYFPEQRRLMESSISVPITAESTGSLAASCGKLRSLRLCVGYGDVKREGLAQLSQFSSLKALSIHAEPFGTPPCPVALELSRLPLGLTSLELRHVDVMDCPQALISSSCRCLHQLACLKLESCRLRAAQLQALANSLPELQSLKLVHVAGLCNEGVASLRGLTQLMELAVIGSRNKALSQESLQALAGLRNLRYLTWESDDLSSQGPVLDAFTHFTVLRLLSLSCTSKTLSNACGSRAVFRELMPYCDLDLVGLNRA